MSRCVASRGRASCWSSASPAGAFRRHEPAEDRKNFLDLFAWHTEGRLHPRIDRVLPLDRAAEALNTLNERSVTGKIVLTVAG